MGGRGEVGVVLEAVVDSSGRRRSLLLLLLVVVVLLLLLLAGEVDVAVVVGPGEYVRRV